MNLKVPIDWRNDPGAVFGVAWRIDAVAAAGLTETIERLSYAWTFPPNGI